MGENSFSLAALPAYHRQMSCPTCHNSDWVRAPTGPSLLSRFAALFSRRDSDQEVRRCTFCGSVYKGPDPDSDDDAAISERMSRIQEQMSSFGWTAQPSKDPMAGLPLTEAALCLGCGETYPEKDRECPRCGWRPKAWIAEAAEGEPARDAEPGKA